MGWKTYSDIYMQENKVFECGLNKITHSLMT